MDQSKKTMRHFYCRDVLWETFEQMANDFDCSIDYLVNEAMRYYARSKNYQSPGGPQMTGGQPVHGDRNNSSGATYPPPNKMGPRPGGVTSQPPMGPPGLAARRPAPPTPGDAIPARPGVGPGGHIAPHAPPAAPPMPPSMGGGPTLFLIYNGQRYPVTKDQFIIGRGSKTSDLPIKDGNISRKH